MELDAATAVRYWRAGGVEAAALRQRRPWGEKSMRGGDAERFNLLI